MIDVSIIIPCHNHGKFIDDAVNSVLHSTYKNLEIIIVNDGSDDEFTNNLLNDYKKEKTTVISIPNSGPSKARNIAISKAKGKYILPLDADDKISHLYIEEALNILKNNPEIGIVYSQAEFFGSKTGEWYLPEYDFVSFLNDNCIFVSAFFKKEDWEKVNGYKEEMKYGLEDWEFFISLIEKGLKPHRIPKAMFYYRQCSSSRSSKVDKIKLRKSLKQILEFHKETYLENISDLYPFFKKIFSEDFEKDKGGFPKLLERLFSVKIKQGYKIIRLLGLRIKIKQKISS